MPEGFKHEYIVRFNKKMIVDSVAKRMNRALMDDFPEIFITKAIDKLKT